MKDCFQKSKIGALYCVGLPAILYKTAHLFMSDIANWCVLPYYFNAHLNYEHTGFSANSFTVISLQWLMNQMSLCVPVAQWLEHCISSAKVVGSIPRDHMY